MENKEKNKSGGGKAENGQGVASEEDWSKSRERIGREK